MLLVGKSRCKRVSVRHAASFLVVGPYSVVVGFRFVSFRVSYFSFRVNEYCCHGDGWLFFSFSFRIERLIAWASSYPVSFFMSR